MHIDYSEDKPLLGEEINEISKKIFIEIIGAISSEQKVDLLGSFHNYRLFTLFMFYNNENFEDSYYGIYEFIDYINEVYAQDQELLYKVIKESITDMEEALNDYWVGHDISKAFSQKRKPTFRNKVDTIFRLIDNMLEKVLKKESSLIYKMSFYDNNKELPKNIKLASVFDTILNLPIKFTETINKDKFLNISINQWRNIACHRNYSCKNNMIEMKYSNNNYATISIEKLEEVLFEIGKIRTFIKLTLNLTLDIFTMKHPELREINQHNPQSVILDVNSFLDLYQTKILEAELCDELIIDDMRIESKDKYRYYILKIESHNENKREILNKIIIALSQLIKIFNEYNSIGDLDDIMWVAEIIFTKLDYKIFLNIGYDEIELLQKYPERYFENMERKLKKESMLD